MKLGRFNAILDAYGAMPERWPERERAEALLLARSSLPAARALAQARALDAALQSARLPDAAVDTARFALLQARIVSAAQPRTLNWFARWFGIDLAPSQLWPSVAGLAFATLLGFGVGMGGLLQQDADHEFDDGSVLSLIDLPANSQ